MATIKGLYGPIRFTSRGYPEAATDIDLLGVSINTILKTGIGERVRRPLFGSGLKRLLFSNVSRATALRAKVEARRAIEQWEPRVVVDEILVRTEESRIVLEVIWRQRGSIGDARRTQVPFDAAGAR